MLLSRRRTLLFAVLCLTTIVAVAFLPSKIGESMACIIMLLHYRSEGREY